MKPRRVVVAESAPTGLYDEDFFTWTQRTAALLRHARFEAVDLEHLAEEVEDMGKRDLREMNSRLRVLLIHLLKWRMQPSKRSPSWRSTILTQRQEIADLLQQSPSLRAKLSAGLATNYGAAVARAAAETRTEEGDFTRRCPFTIDQILDRTFLP